MKFDVSHVQEPVGYRVNVRITAEAAEDLDFVVVKHNASTLLTVPLEGPGHTSFSASIPAGGISPGLHTVVVTCRLMGGRELMHTHVWSDQA